jgi:hypothetical protein
MAVSMDVHVGQTNGISQLHGVTEASGEEQFC